MEPTGFSAQHRRRPQISCQQGLQQVADLLETSEPGQALGPFIHSAVHGFLEDLIPGNTGAGVTPPGADIREAVTAALDTTEPGQALASFIHDAFHEILDDLNLGTIGSFIHDAVHEILEVNPVFDPFGQGLSEFIHDFRSDWHLMWARQSGPEGRKQQSFLHGEGPGEPVPGLSLLADFIGAFDAPDDLSPTALSKAPLNNDGVGTIGRVTDDCGGVM